MPTVITFYSFKGGVGRTQAVANMAVGLANRGRKVVIVDLDLESPGLHAFFYPAGDLEAPFSEVTLARSPGFLEYLETCVTLPEEEPRLAEHLLPCAHPSLRPDAGWIRLLPAGRLGDDYPARVSAFSWDRFYAEAEGYRYMELFRDQLLRTGADFVLLDSRTGMTDVANICTFQLPDVVVILFGMHQQGIDGTRRVAQAIVRCNKEEGTAVRSRRVLLVPSRVEEQNELVLRDTWILRTRAHLEGCGELLAGSGQRIPYMPEFAYGERVAIDPLEPNGLSEAYARLLDNIDLGGRPLAARPPSRRTFFSELKVAIDQMEAQTKAFLGHVEACHPATMPLEKLQLRVHDLLRTQNDLVDRVRQIRLKMRKIAEEVGGSPSAAEEPEVSSLDTTGAWKEVPARLRQAADEVTQRWMDARRRRLEEALLAAADQDRSLVAEPLSEIEPWIQDGNLDEIETRLPILVESIKREGLEAFLRRGTLDRSRLGRSRPMVDDQDTWIDERLDKALAERSPDEDFGPLLRNLLQLRVEGLVHRQPHAQSQPFHRVDKPTAPTHLHWTAYDALCSSVQGDALLDAQVFREIGLPLWQADWARILSPSSEGETLDSPLPRQGQRQLQQAVRARSTTVEPLIDLLVSGLIDLWSSRKDLARRILARRRDDPCLQAAFLRIRGASAPVRLRREILAAWLIESEEIETTPGVIDGYLAALVEEGLDAEAFYALQVFRTSGRIHRTAEVGCVEVDCVGLVCLAFLLRALETASELSLRSLLSDQDILNAIDRLRPGKATLALLTLQPLQPLRFLKILVDARSILVQKVLYSTDHANPLPDKIVELLKQPPVDLAKIARIGALIRDIREAEQGKFYGGWPSSRHYEADFRTWASEQLRELLDARASRDSIRRQYHQWNARQWVHQAFQAQTKRGERTGDPEGTALQIIVDAFNGAKAVFLDLNELRPESGSPTLAESLKERDRVVDAMGQLRVWLGGHESADPTLRALARRVTQLISTGEAS